jgi:hypothetical protein
MLKYGEARIISAKFPRVVPLSTLKVIDVSLAAITVGRKQVPKHQQFISEMSQEHFWMITAPSISIK